MPAGGGGMGGMGGYGLLSPTVQRSKEKERPGSDAGPFCISYTSISTTTGCLLAVFPKRQRQGALSSPENSQTSCLA